MSTVDELESLFERFKSELAYRRVCRDGAVDAEAFASAKVRVVFVLKEVNEADPNGELDLRGFLRSGGRGQTWNNVARWTQTILRGVAWPECRVIDGQIRRETLRSIAVVNLNKEGGGATAHLPLPD
jgi:hypothetical protein